MARLSWCGIVLVALLVCSALAEDKYTNKFDNFDIDKVLSNHRILTSYIKCLLDEGTCTNEGRELKSKYRQSTRVRPLYHANVLREKFEIFKRLWELSVSYMRALAAPTVDCIRF